MLNTFRNHLLFHGRPPDQESLMDGMRRIGNIDLDRWQPREAPRASGCIYGAVVMAIIAAATLLTILALDYASIQLPAGTDALTWPPLG